MRRKILMTLAALVAAATSLPLAAQDYPNRPVKIINPFPGGPTDSFARIVARKLQEGLGQPVIVEARPGAGGTIAVGMVAKSPPDGYTLLVTSASTQVVQPVVRKTISYDAERDFVPIMSTGSSSSVIVVHPSVQVTTMRELIEFARANPGAVTYGSSGNGTALHLAGEVFASVAGVQLQHIPYKTAAQSMNDLLGGQVKAMFDSPNNSAPQINAGKLRGLAVMGPVRLAVLPEVPTTAELGIPTMRFSNWLAVYAPAGTPPAIVERVTNILRRSVSDADMKEHFDRSGMPQTPLFGVELAQSSRTQRAELADIVKRAGIPLVD
jgi:tripartite-type tricarboxylate transporter receptor subunit TctC